MAALKIIHAAVSNPSSDEDCPYCSNWMNHRMNK
jgi:hypothetical protein